MRCWPRPSWQRRKAPRSRNLTSNALRAASIEPWAACCGKQTTRMSRSSLAYLRPYRGVLLAGVVTMLATNLCYLGVAAYLKRCVDALTYHHVDQIPRAAALLAAFAVATAITRIYSRVTIFNAARAAEYDLRSD